MASTYVLKVRWRWSSGQSQLYRTWETFKLIDRGNGNVALQASNGQYVCAEGGGGQQVVANRNAILLGRHLEIYIGGTEILHYRPPMASMSVLKVAVEME